MSKLLWSGEIFTRCKHEMCSETSGVLLLYDIGHFSAIKLRVRYDCFGNNSHSIGHLLGKQGLFAAYVYRVHPSQAHWYTYTCMCTESIPPKPTDIRTRVCVQSPSLPSPLIYVHVYVYRAIPPKPTDIRVCVQSPSLPSPLIYVHVCVYRVHPSQAHWCTCMIYVYVCKSRDWERTLFLNLQAWKKNHQLTGSLPYTRVDFYCYRIYKPIKTHRLDTIFSMSISSVVKHKTNIILWVCLNNDTYL